ncbi:UNVERIFIED_CONTAM: hypothetical protein PYX00_004332 [Menopon gallinae]|uniref:MIF4G domain-containing protein n=1 Tax=Menopon gallinae TaxID=328185 RepID=A0AAW2I571_9NEOP
MSNPLPNDPGYINRICGFGLILAELFLQIQIEEKCIVVLGEGLLNILQIILNSESEKSIKCVCQVLKLTGVKLEEISESSSKKLDELFSGLRLIMVYPDLDPNLRFIIQNVIEMRDSRWGQNRTEQSSCDAAPVNTDGYDEPVFFGPDGKVITEEETSFLHDNIPLSEDIEDYVW